MKFNRILEHYVKENDALTKIMLKVDPKNSSNKDFRHFDGYVGYILKENNGMWSILFENLDVPITDVPFSIMKVVDVPCDDTLYAIKMFSLKALEGRRGLTMEIINKIMACNEIDFLEQYLKEEGLGEGEIKDIYKKCLKGDVPIEEGIADVVKKIGRGAATAAVIAAAPDYALTKLGQAAGSKFKAILPQWLGGQGDRGDGGGSSGGGKPGSSAPSVPPNIKQVLRAPFKQFKSSLPFFNIINRAGNALKKYSDRDGNYYHNERTGDVFLVANVDPLNNKIHFFNLNSKKTFTTSGSDPAENYINALLSNLSGIDNFLRNPIPIS